MNNPAAFNVTHVCAMHVYVMLPGSAGYGVMESGGSRHKQALRPNVCFRWYLNRRTPLTCKNQFPLPAS